MRDYKSTAGGNTTVILEKSDDPPPPAYSPAAFHLEAAAIATTAPACTEPTTIMFPRRLVYVPSWLSSTSFIGRTKDGPLFAVETPSKLVNCFGLGRTVLHAGPDKKSSPAVASVGVQRGSKFRRSLIRVGPGSRSPGAGSGSADEAGTVEVTMSGDWCRTHSFSLLVAGGRLERFEWRHSHGDEVRELSGGFNVGWKLVRLDSAPVAPYQDRAGKSYTSDGKEVVAVGAQPRLFRRSPEFAFVGTGARGELGETFEIVAVMGFLRLYELSVQQSAINASAASSSSVAVAVS
ncbi:hypothetical protein JDV02_009407 [Purpureocillium takamizusanense]|uniref:Uncharacterized protein n=1 Tax=Purpureocillium takamizusanense TaxID=2060973 RepID=A0A9Q8VG91_9HYPO|nr:uncharacterized protein JDV02_009407 [Purpureocillium takamizusanense]UNI23597.1 hypothetical protein JDV02_009407 [Purpureocillium takamizusanense]